MKRYFLPLCWSVFGFLVALGMQQAIAGGPAMQQLTRMFFADDVVLKKAGETNLIIHANDDGATSDATLRFKVNTAGTTKFTAGVDSGDSDRFKIESNDGLGTSPDFVMEADGNIGLGTTGAEQMLHVDGAVKIENPLNVGRLTINHVANEAANNYIRGSIFSVRDGDLNWDTANDWWDKGAGASNDWAAWVHRNNATSFLGGPSGAITNMSEATFRSTYEHMTILNSNGNVGIGTISPSNLLDVAGTVEATAFTGDGSSVSNVDAVTLDSLDSTQFLRSDAADTVGGDLTLVGATGLEFVDGDGTHGVRIAHTASNGYLNFTKAGSTNADIYIQSSIDNFYVYPTNLQVGLNASTHVNFGDSNTVINDFDIYLDDGTTYKEIAIFSQAVQAGSITTNAGDDLLIDNPTADVALQAGGGNVGIGTSTPAQLLQVAGAIQVDGAITAPEGTLRDDAGGWVRTYGDTGWYSQTHGGGWYMSDTTWIRSYNNKSIYHNSGTMRTDGTFQVGASGVTLNVVNGGDLIFDTDTLVAKNAGNVGIGTATPGANLHIYQARDSADMTMLQLTSTGTGAIGDKVNILFQMPATGAALRDMAQISAIHNDPLNNEGNLAFSTGTSGVLAEAMRINNDGNVGIGSTNPSDKLDMGGNKIVNVATPTASTDAANKSYVDSSGGGLVGFYKAYSGNSTTLNSWVTVLNYTGTGILHGVRGENSTIGENKGEVRVTIDGTVVEQGVNYGLVEYSSGTTTSPTNGTTGTWLNANSSVNQGSVTKVRCTLNGASGTIVFKQLRNTGGNTFQIIDQSSALTAVTGTNYYDVDFDNVEIGDYFGIHTSTTTSKEYISGGTNAYYYSGGNHTTGSQTYTDYTTQHGISLIAYGGDDIVFTGANSWVKNSGGAAGGLGITFTTSLKVEVKSPTTNGMYADVLYGK